MNQNHALPEIIAHRGASHDAPENTLRAVRLGWEQNADAVEIDVRLCQDGAIVVLHDDNTYRTTGHDEPVVAQTLSKLQSWDAGRWKGEAFAGEHIPTLAQVVNTIPNGKRLVIEVKCGPEIALPLAQTLAHTRKPQGAFSVIAFSYATLETLKKALPTTEMYWLHALRPDPVTGAPPPPLPELITRTHAAGFTGINFRNDEAIDAAWVKQLHDANLKCLVWTVDDSNDARRLASAGVDALTTNRPAYLRGALNSGA